jgi:transcription antitermination factor NusG
VSRSSAQPFVVTSGDFAAPGRTEFVRRACVWVEPLVARLASAGVDIEAGPLPAAKTHAMALRRPGLGPRAALILEIDEHAIEVALELPVAAPEVEVFRHQLQRASSAERIFGALSHLPEPFAIAVHGDEPLPLSAIDVMALQELLRRSFEESKRLRIGWHLLRGIALTQGELELPLAEQLEGALAALAVPFALLAREDARPPRARLPFAAKLFRRSVPSRRTKKPAIVVGTRVRIGSGPFEGKEAMVEELDSRGGARVRLGLLATRIDVAELDALANPVPPREPSGKHGSHGSSGSRPKGSGRPALGSSHRKR